MLVNNYVVQCYVEFHELEFTENILRQFRNAPLIKMLVNLNDQTISFSVDKIDKTRHHENQNAIDYDCRNVAKKRYMFNTLQYVHVCSTVASMLSGLETRSLGFNILGTTQSLVSSQSSKADVRSRLPGFNQY